MTMPKSARSLLDFDAMRIWSWLLLLASPAWAGGYYECKLPDGRISFQLVPCSHSAGRFIVDNEPPVARRVGDAGKSLTTQVAKAGNHFTGTGAINDVPIPMMVDSGASFVSVDRAYALRAGLPASGRPVAMVTANGRVSGYLVHADKVRFAGHEVRNVEVVVQVSGRAYPGALLGMSFLRHFDLNMNGDVLTLHRK